RRGAPLPISAPLRENQLTSSRVLQCGRDGARSSHLRASAPLRENQLTGSRVLQCGRDGARPSRSPRLRASA
ncbi:MAG: hypothetical protein IJR99_16200, partial [Kiritimatiellae bacterium]|nr:hypothetical protein [Kiritimatiellia bacterium]